MEILLSGQIFHLALKYFIITVFDVEIISRFLHQALIEFKNFQKEFLKGPQIVSK